MKRAALALLLVLLGLMPLVGCGADEMEPLPVRAVELEGQVLQVEVAATQAARVRGLMFRRRLDAGKGMLFVWPEAAPRSFWMKNTYLPLDMVFLRGGKVVGVVADAKPLDETGLMVDGDSDMVLEVNAGWAAAHGVGVGDVMRVR